MMMQGLLIAPLPLMIPNWLATLHRLLLTRAIHIFRVWMARDAWQGGNEKKEKVEKEILNLKKRHNTLIYFF